MIAPPPRPERHRQRRSLPLVVLPTAGRADAATVSVADSLRPRAILLSESSARGPRALLSGPGAAPIVSYSAAALSGGPGPAPSRTPVKIRQRALADSWLAADAADADDAAPRAEVRLITTVDQAATLAEAGAPWIKPVTLTRVLAGKPAEWDEQFAYGSKATDAELSSGQLGEVRRLAGQFGTYADLLVDRGATAQAKGPDGRGQRPVAERRRTYAGFLAASGGLAGAARQVSIFVPSRVLTTAVTRDSPSLSTTTCRRSGDPRATASGRRAFRSATASAARRPVDCRRARGTNRTANVQVRAETNGSSRSPPNPVANGQPSASRSGPGQLDPAAHRLISPSSPVGTGARRRCGPAGAMTGAPSPTPPERRVSRPRLHRPSGPISLPRDPAVRDPSMSDSHYDARRGRSRASSARLISASAIIMAGTLV